MDQERFLETDPQPHANNEEAWRATYKNLFPNALAIPSPCKSQNALLPLHTLITKDYDYYTPTHQISNPINFPPSERQTTLAGLARVPSSPPSAMSTRLGVLNAHIAAIDGVYYDYNQLSPYPTMRESSSLSEETPAQHLGQPATPSDQYSPTGCWQRHPCLLATDSGLPSPSGQPASYSSVLSTSDPRQIEPSASASEAAHSTGSSLDHAAPSDNWYRPRWIEPPDSTGQISAAAIGGNDQTSTSCPNGSSPQHALGLPSQMTNRSWDYTSVGGTNEHASNPQPGTTQLMENTSATARPSRGLEPHIGADDVSSADPSDEPDVNDATEDVLARDKWVLMDQFRY